MPVSFKVAHELRAQESDPKLADLVAQLEDCVEFDGRRVLYQWIGGTRSDWRGQGHFRALTEEQEVWAIDNGFDEIIVKTKNRFYEMRSTLAQLHFDVIRFVPAPVDPGESKVFLSKRLGQHVHRQPSQPPLRRPDGPVIEPDRVGGRSATGDPYRHVADPAVAPRAGPVRRRRAASWSSACSPTRRVAITRSWSRRRRRRARGRCWRRRRRVWSAARRCSKA